VAEVKKDSFCLARDALRDAYGEDHLATSAGIAREAPSLQLTLSGTRAH
jgi:hypothetical protein